MTRKADIPGGGDRRLAFGRSGEDRACQLLEREGFEILARNLRTRFGEIDILAREGSDLVFVEVKARSTLEAAVEAVDGRKQRRIGHLAASLEGSLRQWLARVTGREGGSAVEGIRFDVVAVGRDSPEPLLLRAAFDGPDGC